MSLRSGERRPLLVNDDSAAAASAYSMGPAGPEPSVFDAPAHHSSVGSGLSPALGYDADGTGGGGGNGSGLVEGPDPGQLTPSGHVRGASTWVQVAFTIINGFIGGGLLGLPFGFMKAGLITSLILLVLLAALAWYTLNLLGVMKTQYSGRVLETYADIGEEAFGNPGRYLVNFFVALSQLGYAAAYLVFIVANLTNLTVIFHPVSSWFALAVVVPILILLSWVRKISYLSPTAMVSFVAVLIAVGVVIYFGVENQEKHPQDRHPLHDYNEFNAKGMAIFFGISAFAYVQHGLILGQQSSLREPNHFGRSLGASVITTTVVYIIFGICGYFFFFNHTDAVITKDLGDSLAADIVKLSLSAVLIFAFPLQLYPVSSMIESALLPPRTEKPLLSLDTLIRNAIRLTIVIIAVVPAHFVPLFGLFSSLVGCFSNSTIAFVFPPLFYVRLFYFNHVGPAWTRLPKWKVIPLIGLCLFGFAAIAVSSSIVISDIACSLSNPKDLAKCG